MTKIIKKPSPFNSDPHNHRGQKGGGKKGLAPSITSTKSKGGKQISAPKFKGGSGGDR